MLFSFRQRWIERNDFVVVFVVIEDYFKEPLQATQIRLNHAGRAIAVLNTFWIPVDGTHAIALIYLATIYVPIIFFGVLIDNDVAFVVVTLTDEPGEYSFRVVPGRRIDWGEDS